MTSRISSQEGLSAPLIPPTFLEGPPRNTLANVRRCLFSALLFRGRCFTHTHEVTAHFRATSLAYEKKTRQPVRPKASTAVNEHGGQRRATSVGNPHRATSTLHRRHDSVDKGIRHYSRAVSCCFRNRDELVSALAESWNPSRRSGRGRSSWWKRRSRRGLSSTFAMPVGHGAFAMHVSTVLRSLCSLGAPGRSRRSGGRGTGFV